MEITLRRLKPTDIDLADVATALNAADGELAEGGFTEQSLQAFLTDPGHFYLLAYRNGELAGASHGYLMLHPSGAKYLYIDEVDTFVSHRRQGVARAMMTETFQIGRELGATEAWLGTEHDNDAANALYNSLKPSEIDNGPIYTYKIR